MYLQNYLNINLEICLINFIEMNIKRVSKKSCRYCFLYYCSITFFLESSSFLIKIDKAWKLVPVPITYLELKEVATRHHKMSLKILIVLEVLFFLMAYCTCVYFYILTNRYTHICTYIQT